MPSSHPADGWAQLRFAIIGPLLAAPPEKGELATALKELAERHWRHPLHGHAVTFSVPTLERWYYRARGSDDPVAALRPRRRGDAGRSRTLAPAHIDALRAQYREHSGWTIQLHYDNLVALAAQDAIYADVPSYGTVRRFFRSQECRYLVKDFGTSQSPKSTRQRDSRYCPDRPALITTPSRTLQQSCSCATPS
ncbi:MAG: hypothetical protein C3L25_06000 [Candidatus Sedimenticola endophacoides]|nr:MAG: hypothetical protein C3L26_05955 [Candidatus Sedimenticola endophacoides]PUE00525.1 MAG: hypothetical protein C3L26_05960 [Candidatus Sedimenticola endophacoides]PUE00526.1 MAG: hypothetical protein C3L26_05965 [Candidatus Sedimenticola endophacoides]PUE04011.1 MAG: hypothetical protein C3L25_05990 [Candidatus Sedimenticola endophacoides]PUE04012.1 MAG: hypothetical protein C3L25_05995 [Candidatus Sedimenticola endophacoides]